MLKFTKYFGNGRAGLAKSNEDITRSEYDVKTGAKATNGLGLYSDICRGSVDNFYQYPVSKLHSASLKSLTTTTVQPIRQKASQEKTTFNKYSSKSLECVLSTPDYQIENKLPAANQLQPPAPWCKQVSSYAEEEPENMATLRRVESERKGAIPGPRLRQSSICNTVEDHQRFSSQRLPHAQSIDGGLNRKYNEDSGSVKLSLYRESNLSHHLFENLGSHRRTMSQRELSHPSTPDGGIVDAFGFAASGGHPSGYPAGAAYYSSTNLQYNARGHKPNPQPHRPSEVPPLPVGYQPMPAARTNTKAYRSPQQDYNKSGNQTDSHTAQSTEQMDKENFHNHRREFPNPALLPQGNITPNIKGGIPRQPSHSAPVSSKQSIGPKVRRVESVKRIMQNNKKAVSGSSKALSGNHQSQPPQQGEEFSPREGSEVITQKGRSVKSIVGMFDQPAIHQALANARLKQANDSLREEGEPSSIQVRNVNNPQEEGSLSSRSERNDTQVVHIAKFVQIEDTPTKPTINYSDAQTSPMQLSPTEQTMTTSISKSRVSDTHRSSSSSPPGGAIIAKAETFSGGPRPKLAIITSSSTSSYMSNDVFTPPTECIDSPVFDAAEPSYHRGEGSSRTYYSAESIAASDGYDSAHNSNIPSHYPYSQHVHLNNQLLRQELAETESGNHYEDLESLKTGSGSINEMENIYEPISPLLRESSTGNYMNFPATKDYMDVAPNHSSSSQQSDRRSVEADHHRCMSMDSALGRQFSITNGDSDFNASHEEANYSHQVREASHRTLRQTSIESSSKLRGSPTREEQHLNRYNLNKSNVNPVQPTHRSSTSAPPAVRPQSLQSPYSSEMNLSERTEEFVKMRNKPIRTDSCRVQPRSKPVDRTSSYREPRNFPVDMRHGSDNQRVIRDNLIDFYKRKSRDCSMDSTDYSQSSNRNSGVSQMSQSPSHHSPSRPSLPNMAMHRIQSERSFNTSHSIPNPRANSVDRVQSMNMGDLKTVSSAPPAYMHSWDASAVANRSSSSPLESPRVRKPLVAEVSPFSMPGQKSRKERPGRLEMSGASSSSVGSGALKSVKASPVQTESQDIAPSLPPRNYHPEDLQSQPPPAPDRRQPNSEHDLSKPYQTVFNGASKVSDNDFDAGYTAQLRRVSKHQYVRTSPDAAKPGQPVPTSRPSSQHSPLSHHQSIHNSPSSLQFSQATGNSTSGLSHHNFSSVTDSSHRGIVSPHNHAANPASSRAHHSAVVTPHVRTSSVSSSNYSPADNRLSSASLKLQTSSHVLHADRQQVLETDIDAPSSPEVQPPPPPRRLSRDQTSSKPPPKPPKLLPTIYSSEINHNETSKHLSHDHSNSSHLENLVKSADSIPTSMVESSFHVTDLTETSSRDVNDTVSSTIAPTYSPKVDAQDGATPMSSHLQNKKPPELPSHKREDFSIVPQPMERKDRRSESLSVPTKGEDMTVTSGDPTIHIQRKHSVHKPRHSRRSYSSSSINKDEKSVFDNQSKHNSPTSRLAQRETEFSAVEKSAPTVAQRLDPAVLNNAIQENRPKPFNRYQPLSGSQSASHSRQPSAEILDISSRTESPVPLARQKDIGSPTPHPRSPKHSPTPSRSNRVSVASLGGDSRKSTPSPHSSVSDAAKSGAKSDPSTPIDKSFVPISTEILAELADQGIDITGKHKCISDESKARLVKMKTLNDSSPVVKKTPTIRHIRQKSSDEILCDTQVEHLGKSIKDDSLIQVLSKPQKGTTDYLPGLFDEVLARELPRKQRQSLGSYGSPCHSTQSSDGDGSNLHRADKTSHGQRVESPFDELNTVQEKKEELILVLKKKLSVLQEDQKFRLQEIEDNDASGEKVAEAVERKCNDRETSKYKSYIDDVEKITKLLLKLSRRLARSENELRNAPMDATDDDKKCLEQKRNNLQRQHNDAKALKESIDKRKGPVVVFLKQALDESEFELYDHYISIKLRLIMEVSDIEDQINHCEEQISAVTAVSP